MKQRLPKIKFEQHLQNCLKQKVSNNIVHYFANTDMRCAHRGLATIANKAGINVNDLRAGDMVVFTNAKFNRIKIFTAGNTIAYQKSWNDQAMPPHLISLLPRYFNGKALDFDAAMKDAVEHAYKLALIKRAK